MKNMARSAITIGVGGIVIGVLALLSSSTAIAQSEGARCSNRTLRGDYAFNVNGTIQAGPDTLLLRAVAMTHFDGEGNLEQVDFVTLNGAPTGADWRPATGTYNLDANCTGEATINPAGGQALHLRLVVGAHGTLIHTVVVGIAAGSTGTRVD